MTKVFTLKNKRSNKYTKCRVPKENYLQKQIKMLTKKKKDLQAQKSM